MFTPYVRVNNLHEIIGEQAIADALLDCIIYDAHRLEETGVSLRNRKSSLASVKT